MFGVEYTHAMLEETRVRKQPHPKSERDPFPWKVQINMFKAAGQDSDWRELVVFLVTEEDRHQEPGGDVDSGHSGKVIWVES